MLSQSSQSFNGSSQTAWQDIELLEEPEPSTRVHLPTSPAVSQSEFITPLVSAAGGAWSHQYASLYFVRLRKLKPFCMQNAEKKWKNQKAIYINRILEAEPEQLCWFVGTVFMEMPLKPNVLEDLARANWIAPPPPRQKYHGESDTILLEDESGRVKLTGDLILGEGLVSGVIVAVLGTSNSDGDFEVTDVCYPGPAEHPTSNKIGMKADMKDTCSGGWVALASGLSLGAINSATDSRTQLLLEFLTGELTQMGVASQSVGRLILAGNSMAKPVPVTLAGAKKRYGYDPSLFTSNPASALDDFASQLVSTIPITILPGADDPAGAILPQQPIPRGLLTRSRKWGDQKGDHSEEGWQSVTNPWCGNIDGKLFLGTSGQTIDDIFHYVDGDRLEMVRRTWRWRHLAPTSPDTLWCFPFTDKDPFIMSQCPSVYFVGNQPEFATSLEEGENGQKTRIVLIPKFTDGGEIVLVHTRTLEYKVMKFTIPEWVGNDAAIENKNKESEDIAEGGE